MTPRGSLVNERTTFRSCGSQLGLDVGIPILANVTSTYYIFYNNSPDPACVVSTTFECPTTRGCSGFSSFTEIASTPLNARWTQQAAAFSAGS